MIDNVVRRAWFSLAILVPIIIVGVNLDSWGLTSIYAINEKTNRLIENFERDINEKFKTEIVYENGEFELESGLVKDQNEITKGTADKTGIYKIYIYGVAAIIFAWWFRKYISDRKSGLSLKERDADAVLVFHRAILNIGFWSIVWFISIKLDINTKSNLDAMSWLATSVVAGNILGVYYCFHKYINATSKAIYKLNKSGFDLAKSIFD